MDNSSSPLNVEAKLAMSFNSIMVGTGHLLTYMSTTASSQRMIHNPSMQIQDSINRSVESFDILLDTASLNVHKVRLGLEMERAKRAALLKRRLDQREQRAEELKRAKADEAKGDQPKEKDDQLKVEVKDEEEAEGGETNNQLPTVEFDGTDGFINDVINDNDKSEVGAEAADDNNTLKAITTTTIDNDKSIEGLDDDDLMMTIDFSDINPVGEPAGDASEVSGVVTSDKNDNNDDNNDDKKDDKKDDNNNDNNNDNNDDNNNNNTIGQFEPVGEANAEEIEMAKHEDLDDMFLSMDNDAKNNGLDDEFVSFDNDNDNNIVDSNNNDNEFVTMASKGKAESGTMEFEPVKLDVETKVEDNNNDSNIKLVTVEKKNNETENEAVMNESESEVKETVTNDQENPITIKPDLMPNVNMDMDINMDIVDMDMDMNPDLNMIDAMMDTADSVMANDSAINGLFGEDFDFVIP